MLTICKKYKYLFDSRFLIELVINKNIFYNRVLKINKKPVSDFCDYRLKYVKKRLINHFYKLFGLIFL